MAPIAANMSILVNPLATVDQISQSGSQLDGVPADLENSIRFAGARLTQAAGILLRLPQDIIAQAIVIFTRFFVGPEGGSLKEYGAKVRNPVSCIEQSGSYNTGCIRWIIVSDGETILYPQIPSQCAQRVRLPGLIPFNLRRRL